ncbi:bifunctional 2',3'-cyclic-nucleotide 2'-phosphodiesterase/3'-nucleotidase [Aliagarivorans taiwanensis]|uniref:bifunctional 2',3'-cyclic-nucleotide 2'-phosphodiesterase/3'-nucleotidase n=1 Tax=Aliagarivorans taiwanensis TaxID=561966 RepID=UPI00040AC088|nr:bifunctional 2',3'-cyclic-nucleotide 2'-phosphodiesterase/3'-nucleotidase [Aliagarivorans taiwanensis]
MEINNQTKYLLRMSAVAVASVLAVACGSSNSDFTTETMTLRLMETTDLHANMRSFNYFTAEEDSKFGFSRTALVIEQAREQQPNHFLVDNGDLIQGAPFGDYVAKQLGTDWLASNTHPIYRAMNLVGYDAANMGNHEFNFGLPFLDASIAGAEFPYVSANVFHFEDAEVDADGNCLTAIDDHYNGNYAEFFENETPYYDPYVIVSKTYTTDQGREVEMQVGVIGFVPPKIMGWDKSHLECQVQVADIVKAAEYYVPKMQAAGADIVVAVPHSGLSGSEGIDLPDYEYDYLENTSALLAQVKGIDAIMFGHDHLDFPSDKFAGFPGADVEAGTIHGVPAVMPGFWGNKLGVIDLSLQLTLDGDQVVRYAITGADVALMDIDETQGEQNEDPRIVAEVAAEHDGTVEYMATEIGESDQPIYSFFSLAGPDLSVQLVNEAQMWRGEQLKADGAFGADNDLPLLAVAAPFRGGRNGTSDFTYVPAGPITLSNVADLYIYPNTLQVVKMTGAQVIEWLEMSAAQFNTIKGGDEEQALDSAGFPTYNFDVFYGLDYDIDLSVDARYDAYQPEPARDTNRILNIMYQGAPLDLAQEFLIVTNNYRASGGGNFPGVSADIIVYEDPEETRNHIQNYLEYRGANAGDDGIIRFELQQNWTLTLGDSGLAPSNVRLTSSPIALNYVDAHSHIEALNEQNAEGYEIFRIQF